MSVLYRMPKDVQAMIMRYVFDHRYTRVLGQLLIECKPISDILNPTAGDRQVDWRNWICIRHNRQWGFAYKYKA